MNTVIFSVYDNFCFESSVLVSDYVGAKAVRTTDHRFCYSPDLRHDEVSDAQKFRYFEALFGERVDRIRIIEDAELIDSVTKVTFGGENHFCHGDGTVTVEKYSEVKNKWVR